MQDISAIIKRIYNYFLFRKRNKYIERLKKNGLKLGANVEIIDNFFFDPSHCFLITIGDRCTICPNVRLIAHDASTKLRLGFTKIGKIEILEDCFIGDSAVILPNVRIGPNTIVGAGAVVTKNAPKNTIIAGNPARVICSIDEYLNKITRSAKGKKIYSAEYYIDLISEDQKKEMLNSLNNEIGFIL